MSGKSRTVAEVGERELIRLLTPYVLTDLGKSGVLGIGDDCAVITEKSAGARTVLTTDILVEGTHFLFNDATQWDWIGRKAAGANISDIAAMGARPEAMLVSLAIPPDFKVDDVLSLYRGMHSLARKYNVEIVGGDTTRSDRVFIAVTVTGVKDAGFAECRRSDARPGDFVYISGDLGASRAGLELLLNPEKQTLLSPEQSAGLIEHHFSPEPKVELGLALSRLYPRVAAIDISDGVYNDAGLLSEASNVEIALNLEAVPVNEDAKLYCERSGKDAALFALYSGEEYELLFALPIPPDDLTEDLQRSGVGCAISVAGTVNSGSGLRLLKDGHPVDPKDETFVHFHKE